MIKNLSIIVTIFLFSLSILASLSFLQNETNRNKNKAILKSDSYKQQLHSKDQLNDLYNNKKAQIVSLQEQTKQQVEALAGQRDSMPNNYITKKAEINKQITQLQEKSNNQIATINNELDTIVSKQSEEINVKDIAIDSEKGYTAFLQVVAEQLSNEDTTYSVEELEVILFSLISIVFEFTAVLLFIYNKNGVNNPLLKPLSMIAFSVSAVFTIRLLLSNTNGAFNSILIILMGVIFEYSKCFFLYMSFNNDSVSFKYQGVKKTNVDNTPGQLNKNEHGVDAEPEPKPTNVTHIKKNSGIGFQYDNTIQSKQDNNEPSMILEPQLRQGNIIVSNVKEFGCIDKEIVRKYLINAEESKKVKNNGNEVSGVSVLAKQCKITENTGRNVFGYLKHLGIIEVKNKSSFLIKTPAEYNKILDL